MWIFIFSDLNSTMTNLSAIHGEGIMCSSLANPLPNMSLTFLNVSNNVIKKEQLTYTSNVSITIPTNIEPGVYFVICNSTNNVGTRIINGSVCVSSE